LSGSGRKRVCRLLLTVSFLLFLLTFYYLSTFAILAGAASRAVPRAPSCNGSVSDATDLSGAVGWSLS